MYITHLITFGRLFYRNSFHPASFITATMMKARLAHQGQPKKPQELVFVTGNANKLAEVKAILGDTVPIGDCSLDLPELQGTLQDITLDKARRAAEAVRRRVRRRLGKRARANERRRRIDGWAGPG